jgi:hypothetical protein
MTPAARVTAEIDALLLDTLVTQTPIPGVGVDGLVGYLAPLHPTVAGVLIESVLRGSSRRTSGALAPQATSTSRRPSSCSQTSDDARRQVILASDRSAPWQRTGPPPGMGRSTYRRPEKGTGRPS